MIICLIEFQIHPGMEKEQQKWLQNLLPAADDVPGFQGKESYSHVSNDGRTSTVSFWDNEKALVNWTRDPLHREAMEDGKNRIFSSYEIRICREIRHYSHHTNRATRL